MNLKKIWTIFRREIGAYFNSAIAYIYLIVFVAINNGLFMTRFFLLKKADMRPFFDNLTLVLFIFIPVITMRLWAEERKENTFELLMTFPMRPIELVIGKFLASLIFYAVALASSLTIPIMLFISGKPDFGAIFGGYLGALLIGGLFLSIGIFISGLTKEQIVAFVLTVLSCFMIYFLGTFFFASLIDGWIAGLGTFIMNSFGAGVHLEGFNKGIIDFKDIIYFVFGCAVFIFLNSLFFEGRYRPKSQLVFSASVAVCVAIMVVFNWLSSGASWGRFDLTEGQVYTVSPASKRILNNLKAPVYVKAYLTPADKMPTSMRGMEQEIIGKFEEFKISSKNKFNYQVIHIEAAKLIEQSRNRQQASALGAAEDSLERSLQEKGIVPFQVQSIDRDELGVKLIYSAITIDYKEKNQELLPRIMPSALADLEYLLLSRIVKMTFEAKPKIVVFSPLKNVEVTPEMGQLLSGMGQSSDQYEDVYKNIAPLISNNGYDYKRITLTYGDSVPSDATAILIINPGSLNDRQLYEVNKYLYQGGSVVIASQGYNYSFQLKPPQGFDMQAQKLNFDINKLISKWGIKINEDILMDENSDTINVSTGQSVGPFAISMPIKVPNQISVRQETMNTKLPLMARQPTLFYMWGSALDMEDTVIKQLNLNSSVLFTSSLRSWKVPYEGVLKAGSAVFPKAGSPGKFLLGLMAQGQFTDAFSGQAVPEWPSKDSAKEGEVAPAAAEPEKREEKLNPKPGKLIVLGCAKMFSDELIVNPANLNFFGNLIDSLALGDDAIQIRSKSQANRDIRKLSDGQKLMMQFMTVIFVPLVWVGIVLSRMFIRRKEKQFYLMARNQ